MNLVLPACLPILLFVPWCCAALLVSLRVLPIPSRYASSGCPLFRWVVPFLSLDGFCGLIPNLLRSFPPETCFPLASSLHDPASRLVLPSYSTPDLGSSSSLAGPSCFILRETTGSWSIGILCPTRPLRSSSRLVPPFGASCLSMSMCACGVACHFRLWVTWNATKPDTTPGCCWTRWC